MTELIHEAYKRAVNILHQCNTDTGMKASIDSTGYSLVYARDSMITLLGAALVADAPFQAHGWGFYVASLVKAGCFDEANHQVHTA